MYSTETRCYRSILNISFEFGSDLRRIGLLIPDAQTDDGRMLSLLTPEKIRAALTQVSLAKSRGFKDQAAEPVSA